MTMPHIPTALDAFRHAEISEPPPPVPVSQTETASYEPEQGEEDLAKAQHEAELAAYREQNSGIITAGAQGVRGVLDALLAPGALVGAGLEAAGEAWNSDTLKEIGRDYGEASSGKSAMSALSAAFGLVSGDGADVAQQNWEETGQALDKQQEARPMLTTISRIAGTAAFGIGLGAGASATSRVGSTILANAAEGAAGGAQGAYERSEPLRDVLSSAAIGGVLGGAITGAAEGIGAAARYATRKAPNLAEAIGDKLQGFANKSAVDAVIGQNKKLWNKVLEGGPERVERLAGNINAAEVLGKGDEGMLAGLNAAKARSGDSLGKIASSIDESGVKASGDDIINAFKSHIDELRGSSSGSTQKLAGAVEDEVAPFIKKLTIPDTPERAALDAVGLENADYLRDGMRDLRVFRETYAGKTAEQATEIASKLPNPVKVTLEPDEGGGLRAILTDGRHRMAAAKEAGAAAINAEVRTFDAAGNEVSRVVRPVSIEPAGPRLRDPTFSELWDFRKDLSFAKRQAFKSQSPAAEQVSRIYGTVSKELEKAADSASPGLSKLWKQASGEYSDYSLLVDGLEDQIVRKASNRFVSPSDYATSIGSGLATLIMSSNPIAAVGAAIGTGIAHKAAREGGRAAISMLTSRLARFSTRIPKVAGPEMQEVLQTLAKGKRFAESVAESAGDNPTIRQQATELANHAVAEHAAAKAGTMDLGTWATKTPSPLQKVIYRGPLLSRISDDLSRAAQETAEMRPPMPAALDLGKIAKLARDADGPAAIGSVQSAASQIAAEAPPAATGDAIGVVLRRLSGELETADVADAMAKAHDAARVIVELGETASDEASRNFAQRAAISLQDTLGGEAFGGAGRQYQALVQGPHNALEQLSDPKAVRELLRSTQATGELPRTILDAQQRVAAAYDAAFKLAGMPRPADLGANFKRIHGMFEAAERAVTLDGKPVSALFNAAKRAGVYGAAEAHGPDVSETTVSDAIDEKLDKIAPAIRDAAGVGKRKFRPENLSVPATGGAVKAMNHEDPQALYERRMKQLGGFVADPTSIPGGVYAQIGADMTGKMAQLLNDMPKPEQSLLGSVGSQLSRSDLELANAMWEATAEPLSVFDDFARGLIDYSKVSYAWKQYPGLQQAAQAGVLDLLMQDMSPKELDKVPSGVISQLDNLLGFGGKLSTTLDHGFSSRMTQMFQPEPNKPGPGGMLDTPKSNPTFTERLSGAAS